MFKKVLGLDIIPQSEGSIPKRKFSAVILYDTGEIRKFEKISLKKLFKLIRRERPDAVAIDNILEFSQDKKHLMHLISKITIYTNLIEVSRVDENRMEKITVLAKKNGIIKELEGKLTPLKTAEVVAKLAMQGIGSLVIVNENETKIVVYRGRSLGSGGMSARRYYRNLNQMVLRKTNEIIEALKKNGIDFDVYVRKGEGGYERSLIIAYTSRERLFGIVKQEKGYDVNVIIRPIVKEEIEFIPLNKLTSLKIDQVKPKKDRYILVGIDPGIKTGVAVLTLSGRLLLLYSSTNLGRNTLIKKILEYGKPILIATDVTPAPFYVKKIAAYFNAVLFTPVKVLTVEEKRRIVQDFCLRNGIKIQDSHQRDALAAAIKAYNAFQSKFDKIQSEVKKLSIRIPLEEAKALVIQGKSVKDAISEIIQRHIENRIPKRNIVHESKKNIEELEKTLKEKILENIRLQARIRELEKQLKSLQQEKEWLKENLERYRRYENDNILISKYEHLRTNLRTLIRDLNELKREKQILLDLLRRAVNGEIIRVYRLGEIDFKEEANSKDKLVLYLQKTFNGYELLRKIIKKYRIECVIIEDGTRIPSKITVELEINDIPIIHEREVTIFTFGDYLYSDRLALNNLVKEKRLELKKKWSIKTPEELARIIKEYRNMRKKLFRKALPVRSLYRQSSF